MTASGTPPVADVLRLLEARPEMAAAGGRLDERTPLVSSGLIDSMTILELIEEVEDRFAVRFEPDQLTGETFETAASIAAAVHQLS